VGEVVNSSVKAVWNQSDSGCQQLTVSLQKFVSLDSSGFENLAASTICCSAAMADGRLVSR